MKILCFVHGYPPDHNAGAEWMLHAMNKNLISKGHEVRVMTRGGEVSESRNGKHTWRKTSDISNFEGVEIFREGSPIYAKMFKWANIVVTHLNFSGKAMNLAREFNKPTVHLLHNTHHNDVLYRINPRNNHIVYNAEWNKKISKYTNKSMVLYPPVWYDEYKTEPTGKNITLVNCWADKGGNVLVELAKQMPEETFLGVLGGYGDQVIGRSKNLRYEENTPNIKKIYKKSKIILMPSSYESWGRVAVEAMCSGIPVIAHPTPGLKESLDYAGLFAHRDRVGEWIQIINDLQDEEYYNKISSLCVKRAKELNAKSLKQMDEYERFLETIIKKGYEAV